MNLFLCLVLLFGQQDPPPRIDPEFIFDYHCSPLKSLPYMALVQGRVQSVRIQTDSFFIDSELCLRKQIIASVRRDSVLFSATQTPIDTVFNLILPLPINIPPIPNIWEDSTWVFELQEPITIQKMRAWKGKTDCQPPPFKDPLNFLLNCSDEPAPDNKFSEYVDWINKAKTGKQVFQAENLRIVAHFNENKKLEGSYKIYDNFNTLILDGQFKNGLPDGKWLVGELSSCLHFREESRQGSYYEASIYYFENGKEVKSDYGIKTKVYQAVQW